jgi:hypothetical protein
MEERGDEELDYWNFTIRNYRMHMEESDVFKILNNLNTHVRIMVHM